jgi:hypothetical protein
LKMVEGTWDPPASFIPPHPSCKGTRLCNPANSLLTNIVRVVDFRAGRQKDLRQLRMPTGRRRVKWGGLALRRDRSGKDDTQREET